MIIEGSEYESTVVRIAEEIARANRHKRHDLPSLMFAVEHFLKHGTPTPGNDPKPEPQQLTLDEQKKEVRKQINTTIRKIVVYRAKQAGRNHLSSDFAEVQYDLNRSVLVRKIDECTLEQLERMLSIAKGMLSRLIELSEQSLC